MINQIGQSNAVQHGQGSNYAVNSTNTVIATVQASATQQSPQDPDYTLTISEEALTFANAPLEQVAPNPAPTPLNADNVMQRAREIQQTLANTTQGRPTVYSGTHGRVLGMFDEFAGIFHDNPLFGNMHGREFAQQLQAMSRNGGEGGRFAIARMMEDFALNHFDNEEEAANFLAHINGTLHNESLREQGWSFAGEVALRPGESWFGEFNMTFSEWQQQTGRESQSNPELRRSFDESSGRIASHQETARQFLGDFNIRVGTDNFMADMMNFLRGGASNSVFDMSNHISEFSVPAWNNDRIDGFDWIARMTQLLGQ